MNLSKQQLLQIIKEEIASITEDKREEEALAQLREPSDAALVVQGDRSGRSKDVVYEPRQDRKPRGRADFDREVVDDYFRRGEVPPDELVTPASARFADYYRGPGIDGNKLDFLQSVRHERGLDQLRRAAEPDWMMRRLTSYNPQSPPHGRADFERELADKESRTGGHFTDSGATVRPPKELPFPDLESRLAGLRGESLTRLRLRQMVMEEVASMTELGDRRARDPGPGGPPVMRGEMRPRGDRRSWQHVAISSPASLKVGKSVASGDRRASEAEAFSDWSGPPERGYAPRRRESLTRLRLRQMVMEELQVNEEEKWIQGAEEDIEKRGTEGVCTGKKFGGPTCRAGTKRYNLAKTFRKMAKKRKKK